MSVGDRGGKTHFISSAIAKGLMLPTIILLATLVFVPTLTSSTSNAIGNPGFEETTHWEPYYSAVQGSYAAIRDGSVKYADLYSGLTKTKDPKQEICAGYLYQSLSVEVLELGTFYYYVRKGDSATNGYYYAEVQISLTQGYKLHYYHQLNSQFQMPSDTETHKYINVGSLKPTGAFVQVSRNLFADLTSKFGDSITDQSVMGIGLFSNGYKNLATGKKYGQIINWDEIYMAEQSYSLEESFGTDFLVVRVDEGTSCRPFEGACHTIWWNVTVCAAGYRHSLGLPYYYVRHRIIVWQGQFNGWCHPIEPEDDFYFAINNYTCYGLNANEQIVYKTTFGPSANELPEYYNTTCFAEDNVWSVYTYANVTIRDTQYNDFDPCAPITYYNSTVTISIPEVHP